MKRFTAAMIAMLLCSCLCACGDSGSVHDDLGRRHTSGVYLSFLL